MTEFGEATNKQIEHILDLINSTTHGKASYSETVKDIADYASSHERLLFILSNHSIYVGSQAWNNIDTLIRSDVSNDDGISHPFSVLAKDATKAAWLENKFYGHTVIIEDPDDIPDTLLLGADYKVPSLEDIKNALTSGL